MQSACEIDQYLAEEQSLSFPIILGRFEKERCWAPADTTRNGLDIWLKEWARMSICDLAPRFALFTN